jgi:hypothetical protein
MAGLLRTFSSSARGSRAMVLLLLWGYSWTISGVMLGSSAIGLVGFREQSYTEERFEDSGLMAGRVGQRPSQLQLKL